jgi:hypothetical protein
MSSSTASPSRAYFSNPSNNSQAFFIKNFDFAMVEWSLNRHSDTIVNGPSFDSGPKSFHEAWKALKDAKFDTIDCILPHPTEPYQAYFFPGERYCHIEFKPSA